ncbi:PREDICTED: uncharacterized protein LOC107192782 [Dufourea novaeangliae]|uniref:uncharacterized protein LOC107192782 n=1 Tax=Dufourea novaeangliae TaxID=178035 RepID=UPI0007670929|nr:PREDICTED: uncharacterized protein LOC107192782 [Dufourea novaeangliae]
MPRLRKDRGLESRWGVKYYTAVRNAVFMIQTPPYVPPERPPSVKKHDTESDTLYLCPQCKDRFHFRSSLEDHHARKSWILGYWCQQCFMTVCTHDSVGGSLCSACSRLEREKRMYLRNKGLHKTQKLGAVALFFNQCQFLAHLKAHSVTNVNMGDLMLMPVPSNLSQNWDSDINTICEALMEHTFITKVHIMDWLRAQNIENDWWQMIETEDNKNPVMSILKNYKGQHYFQKLEIPIQERVYILNNQSVSSFYNTHSNIEMINSTERIGKAKSFSSVDTAIFISDENEIENEDTPCTINDIAFVDCGPASKHFEPEITVNNTLRKQTTVSGKSGQNSLVVPQISKMIIKKSKKVNASKLNSISSDMIMSYGNTMITPKFNTKDSLKSPANKKSMKNTIHRSSKGAMPIKLVTGNSTTRKGSKVTPDKNILIMEPLSKVQSDTSSSATKSEACKNKLDKLKQNTSVVTVNSGQKYVTFHNTLHIDINTIIKQLPPHIVANKKILFIGQDSKAIAVHNAEEVPSKKVVQLLPDANRGNDIKTQQNKMSSQHSPGSESSDKDSNKSVQRNQIESVKKKSQTLSNKIICHNGLKYIIKQSLGSTKHLQNGSNVIKVMKEVQGAVQLKSTSDIPPLIPLKSTDVENLSTPERVNSLQSDISPLTPSPSPSELSSSSSCDVQSKQSNLTIKGAQKTDAANSSSKSAADVKARNSNDSVGSLSFHKGEDENLYLDMKFHTQKPIYTIVDSAAMITKSKHEMLNEFFHLSYTELKKRHEHLQQLNEEILTVMDFVPDNVVKENLKSVNILQHVLRHCMEKCSEKIDDGSTKDPQLEEWESEYNTTGEKSLCKSCNKPRKPESYIPGFSKSTKNDIYCSCYRHVCHKCDTYQGNSTRFVAHQTFHDKEKPYLCPDCYRKFTVFGSLEAHTWTSCFHPLKKRVLGCKICEIDGFRDMETVSRHFAIMHSHNKIACEKCYIVLPTYSEYQKHCTEKHSDVSDERPIRLALCKLGRCIVRCEEYMLHMEKHLVVQRLIWFTCPFCAFIHVEAKPIMTHLENEHLTQLYQIISPQVLLNILPSEMARTFLKAVMPQPNKLTVACEVPSEVGTIMPKIINTRTITSEVFERGTEEEADDFLMKAEPTKRPKDVKAKKNLFSDLNKNLPKILDVRSIADRSTRSSNLSINGNETEPANKTLRAVAKKRLEIKKPKTPSKIFLPKVEITVEEEEEEEKQGTKIEIADSRSSKRNKKITNVKLSKLEIEEIDADCSSNLPKDILASVPTNRDAPNRNDTLNDKQSLEGDKDRYRQTETGMGETSDTSGEESPTNEPFLKPPPLSKIPQCIFESDGAPNTEQTVQTERVFMFSRTQKTSRQFYQRLALNGPVKSKETVLNFSCPLCGESMNTLWSVVSNHFERKHSENCKLSVVKPMLVRMSPEFINGGYKDVLLGNRKRKSENVSSNSKRRRRWTPKKYSEGRNSNFAGVGLCVTQQTAEDSEGNFRCKKCDQRCSNMTHLREHIASAHRIRGRYLICLECGDNFVVAPSLQMHLKAFHGIDDPIAYMARNTSYAPDSIDDLDVEGKVIEANQCHVCMAVFEDKAAVDKHLRVHGMAFLNRKRIEARNAMKSPEKKNETEEETRPTSVQTSPKEPVRKDKPAETILEKISVTI